MVQGSTPGRNDPKIRTASKLRSGVIDWDLGVANVRVFRPNCALFCQLLCLALSGHTLGQSSSPATANPTVRVSAELVTVSVVVTDKSGAHVHGLKREDFVLYEDNKEQAVANFEEIQEPRIPLSSPMRPNQFSNTSVQSEAQVPLTILVLDEVNTPLLDQDFATQQLRRYLGESRAGKQLTSLFAITRDGVKVLHDFTTDLSAVAASLDNARREGQLVEQASQEKLPNDPMLAPIMKREIESEQRMESVERRVAITITLQSLQQIAQSCAGLPGRKALIWASSGFPFSINELGMVMNIAGVKGDSVSEVDGIYQETWRLLNQAQVALYPVDVRGLANATVPDMTIGNPNPEFASHAAWMQTDTFGTFRTFAQATGGRAFFNTNDLEAAFQSASSDNASYYLLTYYLSHKKKPGWHTLNVKVHRDGVEVRARNGFFLGEAEKQKESASEMQVALRSPLQYTAIPISGEWKQVTPQSGKKKRITFQLTMPANFAQIDEGDDNHMLLQFVAVARTATGETAAEASKTMDGHLKADSVAQIRIHGMDYRGALSLEPGEYTVHFAVQDHLSGRVGSVTAPLKVER